MSSIFHPNNDETINPSENESIREVLARYNGRRNFLKGTLAAGVLSGMGGFSTSAMAYTPSPSPAGGIGFTGVGANRPTNPGGFIDAITVASGYTAKVLIGWGDAIGRPGPFMNTHWDAAQPITEAAQMQLFGQHNDGMHFFPFPARGVSGVSSDRGLICVNHEYVDPGLHVNSAAYATHPLTAADVAAQVAAHGVSVFEVRKMGGDMKVQRPSAFARRVTGKTPCRVSGPAAGNALLKTAADPTGTQVLEITGPVVLAASTDAAVARVPGMKDILAAGKKPVESLDLAALDVPAAAGTVTVTGTARPDLLARKGQMIDVTDPAAAAAELVAALRGAGAL